MDDAQTSQTSLSTASSVDTDLIPTTDLIAEDYPRFRILIVGQSGVGKSSLINSIFKASLADVQHGYKAGTANINEGITSPHNRHLIIHDSEGYTPGDKEKFSILEKFITDRSQKETVAEKLHAIWLCIISPYTNGKILHPWDEKIFQLNQHKVPIIVVYTKFDLFMANLRRNKNGTWKGDTTQEDAEKHFNEKYGQPFVLSTKDVWGPGRIPYTVASIRLPDTLSRLVDATMRSMHVDTSSPWEWLSRGGNEDVSDAPQIALATAQRVDMPAKIAASIRVGRKKYWRAIASGLYFLNVSLKKCLYAIHKDIVTLWNIRYLDEILNSDAFHHRIMIIVEDLTDGKDTRTTQNRTTPTSVMTGLTRLWANSVYKQGPEHIRCLMGYVVDLTLILQGVFRVSIAERLEKNAIQERLNEIIYEFHLSERKKLIHDAIWSFVGVRHPFAKDNAVDKIESLIMENEMTLRDTQLDRERSFLSSLLRIVGFETIIAHPNGPVVNQVILRLVHRLLDSPDHGTIPSELENHSDIQVLLDFTFDLLLNGHLSKSGIPDASRRARRLIFKLTSTTNVIPNSLYITGVKTEMDFGAVGMGGFASVFRGEYGGRLVALKLLNKVYHRSSLRNDFLREAVAWRSLSHRFILPFFGIYEEKSRAFLVSPFMTNGTLSEWRKKQTQAVAEIHRLMLEVAEGVQYLHSDGIIHGDLHGGNVLLDSDFHCQITDFGLTRHSDTTVAWSTKTFVPNFAAPELFGICANCHQPSCSGCYEGHNRQHREKTMRTDVYAFGCLYYAIYFDTLPYEGKGAYEIVLLVARGERPIRLDCPRMDDHTWDLIRRCWEFIPPKRPAMEQIVKTLTPPSKG